YNADAMNAAGNALSRLYTALRDAPDGGEENAECQAYAERFDLAMADDLNTPAAIAVLFDLARECNRLRDEQPQQAAALAATLRCLGGQIGLLQDDADAYLKGGDTTLDATTIEAQIEQRNVARAERNFAEADRIRDALAAQGIRSEERRVGKGGRTRGWNEQEKAEQKRQRGTR